jgi:hypothetical protein
MILNYGDEWKIDRERSLKPNTAPLDKRRTVVAAGGTGGSQRGLTGVTCSLGANVTASGRTPITRECGVVAA